MPPNPPPNTRILLRALLHIEAAPTTCEVTCSDSKEINTSPLTRQELHATAAPHGYSSRAYLLETIHWDPRQRPGGCVGEVSAASSPRHTRGHRAPRRAKMPHRAARTIHRRSPAQAARSCG